MKDLLEYIVKNLVPNPDSVVVEEDNQDGNVNLYLTVHPDDMGLIIGKGGQTIHAIRKVLTVRAIAENVRINLQLVEPSPSAEASGDKEGSEQKVKSDETAKEPEAEAQLEEKSAEPKSEELTEAKSKDKTPEESEIASSSDKSDSSQ